MIDNLYQAECAGIYELANTHELREHSFDIIYQAESPTHAILSAARFLYRRCLELNWEPGSIRVSLFHPQPIQALGSYTNPQGAQFFEWKCDTSPLSLDELRKHYQELISEREPTPCPPPPSS